MKTVCALVLAVIVVAIPAGATTYFLDCGAGNDGSSGRSEDSAWRSVGRVNSQEFQPGDAILLRRGVECSGMLWPKGSGLEGKPIVVGAFGNGPLPIVRTEDDPASLKLFNQQYWHIENLELIGGDPYGIHISGDRGQLRHFRIRDMVVHDVTGEVKRKTSGLVVIAAGREVRAIEDIVIDGVTAYNTTQWAGIIVYGSSKEIRAKRVTVRNSIVHDVYGDGIVLFQVEDGLIEKSAAWLTGLQPVQTIGTPNGIWTWRCRRCVVQYTEGFFVDSPGVDGGVYDIDWGNDDNVVQYNYGHDSQGYCASVFGASGEVTTNSVVRHNVCVNNGRSPKLAKRQGDIYLFTWEGGSLDGVEISDNTIYWNPSIDAPALRAAGAKFTGERPRVFRENLIYSTVPSVLDAGEHLVLNENVVWRPGAGQPDPRLLGALWPELDAEPDSSEWTLLSVLDPAAEESRSIVVFLQAALHKYGPKGLRVSIAWRGEAANRKYDWNLGEIREVEPPAGVAAATTLLLAPGGKAVRTWKGFVSPSELGLTLRRALGPPTGAALVDLARIGSGD